MFFATSSFWFLIFFQVLWAWKQWKYTTGRCQSQLQNFSSHYERRTCLLCMLWWDLETVSFSLILFQLHNNNFKILTEQKFFEMIHRSIFSGRTGCDRFNEWKGKWASESRCTPCVRMYIQDQLLPFWLQCKLCKKFRQVLYGHLEIIVIILHYCWQYTENRKSFGQERIAFKKWMFYILKKIRLKFSDEFG